MLFLFCDSGFSPKEVDYFYAEERDAARAVGYSTALFSLEALRAGAIQRALQAVPEQQTNTRAIYRGWMLKPQQYQQLYEGLQTKNIVLINNPEQYQFCHYLPNSYDVIKAVTPKTTFQVLNKPFEYNDVKAALAVFGEQAIRACLKMQKLRKTRISY